MFEPRTGDVRVRGQYPGLVMKTSIYTRAALNPLAALGVAAALGVGFVIAMRAREE